jgi:hypothetical protein
MSDTLWLLITVASVGLAVVAVAWRGLRVGDHPFCRGCGFDLFGRPADSSVCPECGRDLRQANSMVVGVHRRRRGLLIGGILMLVPSLAAAGIVGWGEAKRVDWQKQKPSCWLAREAQSTVAGTRDAALTELITRLSAKRLSKDMTARLVQCGLQRQADLSKPWTLQWGDLIERARGTGEVSDADWKKYVEQAVAGQYKLLFRSKLRRGDVPPYALDPVAPRLAQSRPWSVAERVNAIEIDGREVLIEPQNGRRGPFRNRGVRALAAEAGGAEALMKDLPLGRHTGLLCVELTLSSTGAPRQLWFEVNPIVVVPKRLPFTFDLVPDDQPILKPVVDESLRARVRASLAVGKVRTSSMVTTLEVTCDPPPTDLALDIIVRSDDGTELNVEPLVCLRGESWRAAQWFTSRFDAGRPTTRRTRRMQRADVIFRPNPDAAVGVLQMNTFWNEEIVFKDVAVDDLLFDTIADVEARERPAQQVAPPHK